MSILIKGVSLPRENEYLDLVITRDGKVYCYDAEGVSVAEAVEVPAHGGLIDREYAIASACSGRIRTLPTTEDGEDWIRVEEVRQSLKSVPAVIPAERSEDQFHPFADSVKMGERSESADKCTKCKYYDSETYSCNDAWLPEGVCPFVERSEE